MLVKETVPARARGFESAPQSKDIKLRPLSAESIYRHYEWANDLELNRLQSELPYEEETFSDFKRRYETLLAQAPDFERHFEIVATDQSVIGVAHVGRISRSNRNCTVSVIIGDEAVRSRGYGRAALELLIAYCFDELEMHRIAAEAFEFNEPWIAVLEQAGFQREGAARDHLYRDGRYWDKIRFALLESEQAVKA